MLEYETLFSVKTSKEGDNGAEHNLQKPPSLRFVQAVVSLLGGVHGVSVWSVGWRSPEARETGRVSIPCF
jgi:hypothetical protein